VDEVAHLHATPRRVTIAAQVNRAFKK
jgi:hypothetical protein